jgi:hypothetical protein
MKTLFVAVCAFLAVSGMSAQTRGWEPSAGHMQVAIWPETVPDAQPPAGPERVEVSQKGFLIAGKPTVGVFDVSQPTLTVYLPSGKSTGVAVIVFPGGGYQGLAIDLEGTEVCDWLTPKGITCLLLKYRVPNSGMHWDEKCRKTSTGQRPSALQALTICRAVARVKRPSSVYDDGTRGFVSYVCATIWTFGDGPSSCDSRL